jgi:hypothetical protein
MGIPGFSAINERATHRRLGFQSSTFLEECSRGTNVPFHPGCRAFRPKFPGQINNCLQQKEIFRPFVE